MKFFQNIVELIGENANLNLQISVNAGKVSVSVLPKARAKDKAFDKLQPIVISDADPKELDEQFFEALSAPLKKVASLSAQVADYEKKVDEVEKNTKIVKDKDEEKKKEQAEADKKAEKLVTATDKLAEKAKTYAEWEKVLGDYIKAGEMSTKVKVKSKILAAQKKAKKLKPTHVQSTLLDFLPAEEKDLPEEAETPEEEDENDDDQDSDNE